MRRGGRARASIIYTRLFCLCVTVAVARAVKYGVPVEINHWDTGRSPLKHMVDVTNSFGLKVLAEHNFLNENNIAFSPYGLTGIMVALYEGVEGHSSYQIQRAMHLPRNRNIMRIGFRDIHRTLKTYFVPEEGFLAGLVLNNENVTFNESYLKVLRFYGFDVETDAMTTTSPGTSSPTTSDDTTTVATTVSTENTSAGETTTSSYPSTTQETTTILTTENSQTSETNAVTSTEVTSTTLSSNIIASTTEITTTTSVPTTVATTTDIASTPSVPTTVTSTTEIISTTLTPTTIASTTDDISTTPAPSTSALTTEDISTTSAPTTVASTTEITSTMSAPTTMDSTTEVISTTSALTTIASTTEMSTTTLASTTISSTTEITSTMSAPTTMASTTEIISTTSSPTTIPSTTEITSTTPASTTARDVEQLTEIPSSTVTTSTETSDVSTATTGNTLIPEDMTSTTESTSASDTAASTMFTTETSTFTMESITPSTGTTDNAESGSDQSTTPIIDSRLETLQRRKKSIVDYLFTNPSYVDEYSLYRSFDIGPEITDAGYGDDEVFLANGLKNIQAVYMNYDTVLDHAYLPHLDASALRLPLDSDQYYLLVVLPNRKRPGEIARLLARMARVSDLTDVYAALRPRQVHAVVPSFNVKGHVILTTDLQRLGIRNVFQPRQNDFTPMTNQSGVYVRNIEQAVSVTIRKYSPDETKKNKPMANRHRVYFSATYPFLYFVMDANIHVALMAGKLVDPLNTRIV
ncbi:uncharacterized protein [Battus philenor]|uniref:uncharacterized protein n=1 Tax=Battus philenor TaxID=42288 RepID=UPI0035CF734D